MTFPNDSEDINKLKEEGKVLSENRRQFIEKYGKLAVVTPLALSFAMQSRAQSSEGGGDGGPGGPF